MHVLTLILAAAMATASPHAMHSGMQSHSMNGHSMKSHSMTSSHATPNHMNGHMNSTHMSGHMAPQPKKTP